MGKKTVPLRFTCRRIFSFLGRTAAICALILCCFLAKAEGAVFRIEPTILVSEEYNDNIFLRGKDNERIYAYITRFAPSVRVQYITSFWDWDINYTYNRSYYRYKKSPARQSDEGNDETHILSARNRTQLIQDHLYLEVRDEYSRVSQDIITDYSQQSPSARQVDQNIFTANPYALFRPSLNSRAVIGYIFQETTYRRIRIEGIDSGVTPSEYVNRDDNIGYSEIGMDLSSRLTFTTGARYTHERNSLRNFEQVDVYAGPRYAYAEDGVIFARGGKTRFRFETRANADENVPEKEYWFWDGGLTHRISTISVTAGARRFVAPDPLRAVTLEDQYTISVTKTAPRYVLTIGGGWSEYRDAVLDQRIGRSEQVQGTVLYRHTPVTTGTLVAGFQNVEEGTDGFGDQNTKYSLLSLRVDHQLSQKAQVAGEYRLLYAQSDDVIANNYINNRYIIEFRYAF